MYSARILGTGSYLPEKRLTNADIEKMVETSDAWIVERTGIRERRVAAEHEATSDLALKASQRALEAANVSVSDLDMILCATVSPDQVMPSTACFIQQKLGAKNIFALDISAACTGFVYALAIANQFVKTGVYKNCLVVGAEVLSRLVNYADRDTAILFGDGAGAVVVGRSLEGTSSRIISEHLHADGNLGHLFELPGGGSRQPFSQFVLDNKLHNMRMKGREIFKNAVRTMSDCAQEAINANGVKIENLDWFIPHQANARILTAVADYFGIPHEKVVFNLDRTGNTSAATIPMALDEAVRDGRIQRGHMVLLSAFGAGLTSGSILMRY